jgi:N-acetylneuraminic acid mutarotase
MRLPQKLRTLTTFSLFAASAICLFAASTAATANRGGLTLDQRVDYQRKIEEVYWRHRAATTQKGQTPVSFADAMPEESIRTKVEETLRKSAALAAYWQRPITGEQLQAEVARIASQTKQPQVLQELFAALDNNPIAIAECLARPLLVERELQNWYARDSRFHGALRQQVEAELRSHSGGDPKALSGHYSERHFTRQAAESKQTKAQIAPGVSNVPVSEKEWQGLVDELSSAFADGVKGSLPDPFYLTTTATAASVPTAQTSSVQEDDTQFYVVSVLEQSPDQLTVATVSWPKEPLDIWWQRVRSEMPVDPTPVALDRFDLPQVAAPVAQDNTWKPTAAALSPRENHTAIWTGSEMIVWGGFYNPSNFTDYAVTVAGRYNPATDSWTLTSTQNAPIWRERHTAVWTGTEMIVWGGYSAANGTVNTGARYNPTTDTWTPTSTTGAPTKRSRHVAVWTGSRMLVFGGRTGDTDNTTTNTGGSYDPVSNTWTALSTTNAPTGREYFTGIWSGTEMIVWGGYNGQTSTTTNTGGRYNPSTNTWQATTTAGAPPARFAHNSVWTGSKMIVWGGAADFSSTIFYNTGYLYDPAGNTWSPISTANAPSPRDAAAAVWTGTEMVIWGGDGGTRLLSGGRYNVASNTWQPVTTNGAPQNSVLMSVVWTGTEMIVWGGQEPTIAADINTGGRYRPSDNTWLPVTNPQNGGPRTEHPAVWTGAEMIVWGSYAGFTSPTNTGGRYTPSTDSWLATSMINVPLYRYSPTAVWTGSEMVVWGGCADSFCTNRLNSGGRYNPATNSWRATSTVGAAEPRYWFSTVWSGTEMIVWGGCDAQTCGPGGSSDRDGLNNGGRYNPLTDTWQAVTTTGAPTPRWFQTAEWSGSEMIVWGGINASGPYNTGGKYNPATNSWTPTTTTNAPTARGLHRSIWTGSKMMVWGGDNSLLDQYFNTGGLYDPAADTWMPTSTAGAPSGRDGHSLIWTGLEAIAWGGCNGINCQTGQNTGARYNPQTDTWQTTSTIEAPSPRDVHSAVWTGEEMIVFGGEPCARCEPVFETGGRYAITGGGSMGDDTVTITRAQYRNRESLLIVTATDSDPSAILTVSVTSTGQFLGTMKNRAGSYTAKFSGITNPGNITVTSNLGGSATAVVRRR